MPKNNFDKTIQEMVDLQDFVSGRLVDRESFTSFVKAFVNTWKKLRAGMDSRMNAVESNAGTTIKESDSRQKKLATDLKEQMGALKSITKVELLQRTTALRVELLREMRAVEETIPDTTDLEPLERQIGRVEKLIPEIKTLPEVWSMFKKLEKRIEKQEKRPAQTTQVRGFFGGRVAQTPIVDDFSGETDGATKIFYLSRAPRNINTTKIWGSDFPYILRVNTDFTIVGKKVTLTSEVDAPSSGATLIAEFYA